MTGTTLNLNTDTSTAANFRLWGGGISAALTTLGFTKTADTGQIDWTTVAAPVAVNTSQGYEIRQFTDSLQATRPIVFKIEYGSASTVATPQMWATVGTASNGSGTITSTAGYGTTVSARSTVFASATSITAFTGAVYLGNTDGSALGLLAWPSGNGGGTTTWAGGLLWIERFRDPNGTANSEGFCFCFSSATNSNSSLTWGQFLFTAGYTQQAATGYVIAPTWPAATNLSTQSIGTTLYPLPVFTGWNPKLQGPSQLVVALRINDLTANTQFAMTHYGVSRTFVAAGNGSANGWGVWALKESSSTSTSASSFPSSFAMRID